MLNRRTPSPRDAASRSKGTVTKSNGFPALPAKPYDLESLIIYAWELERRVFERLDEIFERVRVAPARPGHDDDDHRAIRLPEVLKLLGISKSTLYGRLNASSARHDPRLPRPFKLGDTDRSPSVWWRDSIIEYLERCAELAKAS